MTARARHSLPAPQAIDRLPPHSLEAEQGVLGCVLTDADYCFPILRREGVGPRHFYDGRRAKILALLIEMHQQGLPLDDVLLLPRLAKIDGAQIEPLEVIKLRDVVPSAGNIEYYLPDLLGTFKRRELIRMASQVSALAYDTKQDIALVSDTVEQFSRYALAQTSDDLPEIVPASEFMAEDLPDLPEVVRGVFRQRDKLILSGSSKAGKTWAFLDLAASVASGSSWLDLETAQGPVLYLNTELTPRVFQKRLRWVCKAKGIAIEKLSLDLWHLRGHVAPWDVIIPKILSRVRDSRYLLIVIDPLYKLYGRLKENSAEDMAILTNALGDLAEHSGAALAIATHHSKGNQSGKEAIDRISGSGVLARDADALVDFTANEVENAYSVSLNLRSFAPQPDFGVRWDFPIFRRDEMIDPAKLKAAAGRTPKIDPLKLLAKIEDRTAENPVSVSEWAKLAKIPRPTLQDWLPKIRQKGWIRTAGEGMKARQFITESGLQALNPGGVN